jgi:pimeloyl-ACP methyl ester carboxylesterase
MAIGGFPAIEQKDAPVISRRDLNKGLGLFAAGAFVASQAEAAGTTGTQPAMPVPPKGPWTKSGLLQRAGGQLHYATLGPDNSGKPPIVLLHKLGGWIADWRHVAPALAQGRQVIAFDLPGHGGSRWSGPAPYIQTLGETAALLVGALDEMGIAQVDLLGTSLGGCVSVPLAAYYPERVRRLALISSALGGARTLAEIAEKIDGPQKKTFDAQGYPLPYDSALLAKVFGMVHVEPMGAEGNDSRKVAGHWVQPSERGVGITDCKGLLKRVSAPTLLLYGDKDPDYIKFREGAEANLQHSRTAYVPNSGAFVIQDNPPEAAKILADFVNRA